MVMCKTMGQAQCHSLWISPRGVAGDVFNAIVHDVSETFETPYFPPHVTLLAQVLQPQSEVVAITRELAGEFSPFQIELLAPATTDDYFRSLFISVEPGSVLLAAHGLAKELFRAPEEPYMPHLSLLYGDLSEAEKRKVIARVGVGFPIGFAAEAIDVYATAGAPEDWRLIESVPLT